MKNKLSKARMAKRGIWYFMRTMLIIVLVGVLAVGVFMTAMRISNIYIIGTEGLQLRMNYILQDESILTMQEYFTARFLAEDTAMQNNIYDDYDITSFDYRIEVNGFSVWPWSTTAELTITEDMYAIKGSILESKIPEDADPEAEYPIPEWNAGKYRVNFVLNDNRWYIDGMEWISSVTPGDEAATMGADQTANGE